MPKPPAQRKHGTGDRNDKDVARLDRRLQEERNAQQTRDAKEANRDARHDEGIDHR
ncbi:MAG TPA: hypothetical protein VGU03_11195 [Frateuria sp.]|uniref:hypothetical protein n=1 Tax=Frateuria sp. TaxID=2211372 RepID=UPI002DEB7C28|nr:hypothetical protein [Frateuria sp.]